MILWIALGVALAVAEIFTTTLFLVMFAAGAFAAAGAAALDAPVAVQALVFVVVSALTVVAVRPALKRRAFDPSGSDIAIGMEAIQGASAEVVESVDDHHGMIKIDGELWRARALEGTGTYAPGEHVQVIRLSGTTAVVWRDRPPAAPSTSFE
jgi:membrane protein implicated in regulation of membrane protease activity